MTPKSLKLPHVSYVSDFRDRYISPKNSARFARMRALREQYDVTSDTWTHNLINYCFIYVFYVSDYVSCYVTSCFQTCWFCVLRCLPVDATMLTADRRDG